MWVSIEQEISTDRKRGEDWTHESSVPVSRNMYSVINRKKSIRLHWQVEETQRLRIMGCVGVLGLFGGGVGVSWAWSFTSLESCLHLRWALADPRGTCMCQTWVLVLVFLGPWVFLVSGGGMNVTCVFLSQGLGCLGHACPYAYVGVRGVVV
jgi:hypothetical protein